MRGSRNRVLFAYVGLGLLATSVHAFLPDGGARAILYDAIAASAVLAVAAGLWLHKPENAIPWVLIGAGVLACVAGEVTWNVYSLVLHQDPYPSLADLFYLSGYPLLAGGVWLFVRGRARNRGLAQASLVDAAIVTVAAGVVTWVFLVDPYASDESLSLDVRALSAAYPLVDVLLLAFLARLLLGPGGYSPAFWFLAGGLAFNVAADSIFGAFELTSGYPAGSPLDVLWLLAYVCFGSAALHRSMATLTDSAPRAKHGLTWARLTALAAASVTAPAVLAVQTITGEPSSILIVAVAAGTLPLLALVRMAGLVRELERMSAERASLLVSERVARTEAETAQRLLVDQNDRLRELDRLKDEFVALVSHELRTPLTSITGYLELVLEDGDRLKDEHRQFLGVVDRNSRRLLRLVGDLLFVAQVEAGRLQLEQADVDLGALAADCVEGLRPAAQDKGVDLRLDAKPVGRMRGDRARLSQLLDNLVSNAVKFTSQGGRVVVALGSSEGHAVLAVSDTGMGIPTVEQQRVFERFFRSSTVQEAAISGTGLGLAISKAIVDVHGGTIECVSEEGRGTTFRVRLPFASPQATNGAVPERTTETVV
jgi:signal transduction histidine kinase